MLLLCYYRFKHFLCEATKTAHIYVDQLRNDTKHYCGRKKRKCNKTSFSVVEIREGLHQSDRFFFFFFLPNVFSILVGNNYVQEITAIVKFLILFYILRKFFFDAFEY
uniref:Uncharacterized protein n=1 Tax=Sipha flava TaxID=143950 RepID=A0A2S2QIC3_9HEMI